MNLGLPPLYGSPICIGALPDLKAQRGKLLSGEDEPGTAVHAATFIRGREIVLETQLLRRTGKMRLILTHEVFHFVWARLGNGKRAEYTDLIADELRRGARGELGESALVWKAAWREDERKLRDYVCESFCDTGAWLYAGVKRSVEFQLGAEMKKRRREWFVHSFAAARGC